MPTAPAPPKIRKEHLSRSLQARGQSVSKDNPCPLCGKPDYCFALENSEGLIYKVLCSRTTEAPDGWYMAGRAKDDRPIWGLIGHARPKFFPQVIHLVPQERGDHPGWNYDREAMPWLYPTLGSGKLGLATKERAISYHYPAADGKPLGMVARRELEPRRQSWEVPYNGNTKICRPYHWIDGPDHDPEKGYWKLGKGDRPWPLYREAEALEAIERGGIVFAVGGEKCVEAYRSLGLTAVSCVQGETSGRKIVERLGEAFAEARQADLQPLLVLHPDNDAAGESWARAILAECDRRIIPVIELPADQIAELKPKWDIADILAADDRAPADFLAALANAITSAIERAEREVESADQRARWNAPVNLDGELGYWVEQEQFAEDGSGKEKVRLFKPATDFDFQILKEIASADGGGYLLSVKRADDRHERKIFLKSLDYTTAQRFEDALKRALGDGVICNLGNNNVKALLRVRLHEYRVVRQGRNYRLTDRVGRQSDGVWVFRDRQLDPKGQPTTEDESRWIYNSQITGAEDTLPRPRLQDPNPQGLADLISAMQAFYGESFPLAALVLGYVAAGLHYTTVLEQWGCFPILNLVGDPGSGKTTAAECGLAMLGLHKDGILRDVSISAAYEMLKLTGGLTLCLDDADKQKADRLDPFLQGLYNGKPRTVRGGEDASFNQQRPHSPLMVTSNHLCGENSPATLSRLLPIWLLRRGCDRQAMTRLRRAMEGASSSLPDLIAIGFDAEAIRTIEEEIVLAMPLGHERVAQSLALVLWYSQKVLDLGGAAVDLKAFVLHEYAPLLDTADSAGDSLRDYFARCVSLLEIDAIGPWNFRAIERRDGSQAIAFKLSGVWSALAHRFQVAYSQSVIKQEIAHIAGYNPNAKHRFHLTADQSKAYQRLLLNPPRDSFGGAIAPSEPWSSPQRCIELSMQAVLELAPEFEAFFDVNTSTEGGQQDSNPDEQYDSAVDMARQHSVNRPSTASTDVNSPQAQNQGVLAVDMSTDPSVDIETSTDVSITLPGFEPCSGGSVDVLTPKTARTIISPPPLVQNATEGDLPLARGAWVAHRDRPAALPALVISVEGDTALLDVEGRDRKVALASLTPVPPPARVELAPGVARGAMVEWRGRDRKITLYHPLPWIAVAADGERVVCRDAKGSQIQPLAANHLQLVSA